MGSGVGSVTSRPVEIVGRLTKESSVSTKTRQSVHASMFPDTKCSVDINNTNNRTDTNFGQLVRYTETTRDLCGSIESVPGGNIKLFVYKEVTVNGHDSWSAGLYDFVEPGKGKIELSSDIKTLSFNAAIDLVLAALKINACLNGSK